MGSHCILYATNYNKIRLIFKVDCALTDHNQSNILVFLKRSRDNLGWFSNWRNAVLILINFLWAVSNLLFDRQNLFWETNTITKGLGWNHNVEKLTLLLNNLPTLFWISNSPTVIGLNHFFEHKPWNASIPTMKINHVHSLSRYNCVITHYHSLSCHSAASITDNHSRCRILQCRANRSIASSKLFHSDLMNLRNLTILITRRLLLFAIIEYCFSYILFFIHISSLCKDKSCTS